MKACATIDWQSSLSSDYPTSGGGPDGNAHYRDAAAVIDNRSSWPAAFDWLISCAERFKQVFGPRIGQMEVPGAPGTAAAFAAVEKLGPWSAWTPIEKSREAAPRKPGSTWRGQGATARSSTSEWPASAQAEAPRHPKESTADYPRTSPGKASAAVSSDAALISHSAILRGYVHASLISRRGSDREQRTGEKPRWSPTISTSAGRDHSIAIGIVRWATAAEQSTRQLPGLRVPANGRKRSSATSDVVGGLAFLDRDVHEVPPFGP
jgi:hypothetical protein